MTGPMYLGHALQSTNTDLDVIAQQAANGLETATTAAADATTALTALTIVPNPIEGMTVDSLADYISNSSTLWLKNFGVVGDGVTDDTVAVQAALTAGATYKRVIYGGNAVCKVTAPLTMSGPGLVFDQASYGNSGDPGLYASGTGFGTTPVLTISGSPHQLNIGVYGTGQAANAVYFNNPILATVQQVRVYNFNGYGVKIDKCWDCAFQTISVELCGNTTSYAFSMNNAGDTCNETHIARLQVEQALTQAIYIDPDTLNCTIDQIHSERLRSPNASYYAWVLGGAASHYNVGRFDSQGTAANAKLWLRGAWTTYTGLRAEGVTVYLEGTSSTGITLVAPDFSGTTQEYPAQSGALVIVGGSYGTWSGSTANRYLYQGAASFLPTSGGTMTGAITMDSGAGSATWLPMSSFNGTGFSAAGSASVSGSGGVIDIADGSTIAIVLAINSRNEGAILHLQGGGHSTQVLSLGAGTGTWTTTQGTGSANNVYWNAGSATYRIENTTGSAQSYHLFKVGAVPTA